MLGVLSVKLLLVRHAFLLKLLLLLRKCRIGLGMLAPQRFKRLNMLRLFRIERLLVLAVQRLEHLGMALRRRVVRRKVLAVLCLEFLHRRGNRRLFFRKHMERLRVLLLELAKRLFMLLLKLLSRVAML